MKPLFLPYKVQKDRDTQTYCITGADSHGVPFGVGAGATVEDCERALREWILDSMLGSAADGLDTLGDLVVTKPRGHHIAITASELIPVRVRLARMKAGLRQADAAASLGITQQGYAKLERPGMNPTLRTLMQLEIAFGRELLHLA